MDQPRVTALSRSWTRVPSRRDVLRGLAGAGLGLGLVGRLASQEGREVAARNKERKKPHLNAFGCVDVGKACRGDSRLCCSGVCEGRKPRKGKKDRSRCVAHDASTCQAGQREQNCGGAADVPCITSTGEVGLCNVTTGKAPYCSYDGDCFACRTDADCQPGWGPAAACVTCTTCPTTGGTACVSPTSSM